MGMSAHALGAPTGSLLSGICPRAACERVVMEKIR